MHYVACYIVRMLMRETVAELNVRVRQALSEDPSTNGAHLLALFADFCDLPVEDAKDASVQGDALVLRYGNNLRENRLDVSRSILYCTWWQRLVVTMIRRSTVRT